MNRRSEIMIVKELLAARILVEVAALQDDDFDLGELIAESEEPKAAPSADTIYWPIDENSAKVARSCQVREGQVRRFEVEGVEIAVARVDGRVYALHNLCTHLACHLAAAKIDNGGLTCICHASVFDLRTGEPINPPTTRPVRIYPVREFEGHIYVQVNLSYDFAVKSRNSDAG